MKTTQERIETAAKMARRTKNPKLAEKKFKDSRKLIHQGEQMSQAAVDEKKHFSFVMRKQKDELGRYKIKVQEGFGFNLEARSIIFWLPASTVENQKLFHSVLTKRIATEFGHKTDEVHWSWHTGNVD